MTENEQIQEMARDMDREHSCIGSCLDCEFYLHSFEEFSCIDLIVAKNLSPKTTTRLSAESG